MTIRVEISPESEARLNAAAHAHGMAPDQYAGRLLQEALFAPSDRPVKLTVEKFRAMLGALAEGSGRLPDLPTESFTRSTFYEDRT